MPLTRVLVPVAALDLALLVNVAWMGLLGWGILELIEMML